MEIQVRQAWPDDIDVVSSNLPEASGWLETRGIVMWRTADHVSDLPALLWPSAQARQQPLKVAGPSGAGAFPSIDTFIKRLFDAERRRDESMPRA
jgi:hypothetical protein